MVGSKLLNDRLILAVDDEEDVLAIIKEELKLAYEIILNYFYVTWPKSFFKSVTYASNCLN